MSDETIALPANLASKSRVLYRGTWLSEIRQAVELKENANAVLREIWVRLPSGKDKKWRTNEPTFSALAGHQVGALVSVGTDGTEFVLGMVNYSTRENHIFWHAQRAGCGCALWMFLLGMIVWAERAPWRFYTWLGLIIVFTAITIHSASEDSKERARDRRRLEYLVAAGAPE